MISAKIQQGDIPPEDPSTLLADVATSLKILEDLEKRIALTQAQTLLETGKTLSDALIEQEILLKKVSIFQSLIEAASLINERRNPSEIRWLSTVNIGSLQYQIEEIYKDYRLLETKIQSTYWSTELLE